MTLRDDQKAEFIRRHSFMNDVNQLEIEGVTVDLAIDALKAEIESALSEHEEERVRDVLKKKRNIRGFAR
jgi:hypothetical protein